MIKLVFVIRRREDLLPEEFHRYWLEEHGRWRAACWSSSERGAASRRTPSTRV
jgi:hypothetical protein